MKKQVSGVAGAARINNVNRAGLARAEKHGKRLDQTGQSRAIKDVRPLTTTGLDLQALYDRHVDGVFVPKATSSAMHLLIQWPTELVDGNNADYMLQHARAFAQRVFGDQAIFADRLDRDEASQHVVDLFLAPRYTKTTKRASKVATSTTYHLKLLATKHGEKSNPFGYGRALQTELHEYMRDEMQLEGVQRGKAKAAPGKDWKSAEQLRVDKLDELTARAKAALEALDQERVLVRAAEAASKRRAIEREEALLIRERAIAALEAETAAIHAAAAAARQAAEAAAVNMTIALEAAERHSASIDRDRAAVSRERTEAETDRAQAASERAATVEERQRLLAQRRLHEAQLALLARAADDDNGLEMRRTPEAFSMRREAMQPDERLAYEQGWSKSLIAIARRLADMLEHARLWTQRLLVREKSIQDREAALTAREIDARREQDARRAEHATALLHLQRRDSALTAREQAATTRMNEAETKIAAAAAKGTAAQALLTRQTEWAMAVDALSENTEWIETIGATIRLDRESAASADPKLVALLREEPPRWALNILLARLDLADRQQRLDEYEQAAAASAARLSDLVTRAGPLLNPPQQKVVAEAQQAIRRSAVAAQAWNAGRGSGK